MKRFYIKSILLITVIVLTVKLVDSFLVQDELFHTTHKRLFSGNENFDFLVMGNSLSQRSFNMPYIDSIYNTTSLNIGSSAQHFYTTHLIFNDFINQPELHPKKLLIITISPWQFEILDDETWKFLQMAALDKVSYSSEYFKTLDDFYSISEYPKVFSTTIRFHNKFADNLIESEKRLSFFEKNNTDGFVLNIKSKLDQKTRYQKKDLIEVASKYTSQIKSATEKKLKPRAEAMIYDMIKKCKDHNIKLLFITPPAIKTLYKQDDFGTTKYLEALFKSENVNYLNLNNQFNELNFTFDDFNDLSHLNYFGNKKLAPYLLEYIDKHLNISKNQPSKVVVPKKKQDDTEIITKVLPVKSLGDLQNYRTILTPSVNQFKGQKSYIHSRISSDESAFSSTRKLMVNPGSTYSISVLVKKADNGSLFGLRMQGQYPDRVDAVFDLETGILNEVQKSSNFSDESASIEDLGDGWYKCTLTSKIPSEGIKIILGPTTYEKATAGWEGKTSAKTDIEIAIETLTLYEVFQ